MTKSSKGKETPSDAIRRHYSRGMSEDRLCAIYGRERVLKALWPAEVSEDSPRRESSSADVMMRRDARCLALLRQRASESRIAPTNQEIADALGFGTEGKAFATVARLKAAGKIQVNYPALNVREIVVDGVTLRSPVRTRAA